MHCDMVRVKTSHSFICRTLSSPLIRSVHSDHCGIQFPCPSSICERKSASFSSKLTQSRASDFCKSVWIFLDFIFLAPTHREDEKLKKTFLKRLNWLETPLAHRPNDDSELLYHKLQSIHPNLTKHKLKANDHLDRESFWVGHMVDLNYKYRLRNHNDHWFHL